MTDKPAAPSGLSARGRRFWRSTVGVYDLTSAELEILHEVCRTLDQLDTLADAVAQAGAIVVGSTGQQVVNGALTEARGQRAILHRLIAALALPDEAGEAVPTTGTLRAHTAAQRRWAKPKTSRRRDAS